MNTLIKRSMMLGLSLVLLGTAAVPSCAQKKSIIKGVKAALGKKPPMTGTVSVVKPVTPRVPSTVKGSILRQAWKPDYLEFNLRLNSILERTIATQRVTPELTNFDLDENLFKYADKHGYIYPGLAIARLENIHEVVDEELFINKGKNLPKQFQDSNPTYREVWVYFYEKELGTNNKILLNPYLSEDSPLHSFFELRQQQWKIFSGR